MVKTMKNKGKYDIRYLTFNVSQKQSGTVESIDIYYDVKRIEKIKFLNETSVTQAMNVIGNWLEEEYKPEILTDKEKAYLTAVMKPFREDIKYIEKRFFVLNSEYIMICFRNHETLSFPTFKTGKMYKGMERNKEYTLEELGL